ncbi:MAG TPA: hypothetical protein VJU77_03100 [Chthoniobacterales bacterium]|nr:hypothetical protein [Chthoniobacterales bacterium]
MTSRIPAVVVAGITLLATAVVLRNSSGQSSSRAETSVPEVFNSGPDIITGDIGEAGGLTQFGSSGTQVGLGMSTTGCNAGNQLVNFFAMPSTNHPVIPHNLYRMSGGQNNDDRFEQIGQSWAKHAFGAAQFDRCFVCNPGGDFTHLGVGCSDTYAADQNANQSDLGSRALINPFTGVFQSNARDHTGHVHSGTSHLVLVEASDLDTSQNPGATYYAEVQYISSDEYAWCQSHPGECNMYNNASYRRFNVSGTSSFTFTPAGNAVRMAAAIKAWTGATIVPIEPAPGTDGRAFIAYKVTGPVAGIWHYEYAIYNENLDRAIQSFSIPLGCAITLSNVGFHAPLNHPGFPNDGTQGDAGFSNAPWSSNQTAAEIAWSSETFVQNQNANAIRWGTLYNFRFDSDRSPLFGMATIGFFKTGTPAMVGIVGPNACNVSPSPTPTPVPATPTPTPPPTPTPVPVPSPLQPPGGNGKIAFVRAQEIYVMDADGGNPINITNRPPSNDNGPAWSPDGNKIAFSSNRSGQEFIYVMNTNGSNPVRVGTFWRRNPSWSPDGAKIACDDGSNIYVMNANGTNEVALTSQASGSYSSQYPAWSPDGGKIAFVARRPGFQPNIYVMNADGSNQTDLTQSATEAANPAWSPDGTRIAYTKKGGIFVMSAYGTNRTLLPNTEACYEPAWSPDGTKILATRSEGIFVMNADGSNQAAITSNSFHDSGPSWQRIAPPPPVPGQAVNLSTRMRVQTGDNVGIGGLIVTGTAPKHVLLRAIGPSLAQFGIPNAMADPTLELFGADPAPIASNNDWRDTQEAAIQASGLAPANNLESAIDVTLPPGNYTAVLKGNGDTIGVAVVETYDLDQGTGKLGNISTRALVGIGSDIAIAGFILGHNTGSDRVVIRGIGPSLASSGVANPLPDPMLELRDSNGSLLIANNNWQDDSAQAADLVKAGLAPTNDLESGISATLPPGLYTALLSGVNNGTGVGLVEVYDRGQ